MTENEYNQLIKIYIDKYDISHINTKQKLL